MRQGKKLRITRSPVRQPTPQEPPFRIHVVAPESPKWWRELFEQRNCDPVFHVWADIAQSWRLLKQALNTPCEGVSLILEQLGPPPPGAVQIIEELTNRRIPVVCNRQIGQSNFVQADLFLDPTIVCRLAEMGHRRVLMPYSSDALLKLVPEFFGQRGSRSLFDEYGIKAAFEPLGRSPSMRRLCETISRHVQGKNGVTALFCYEPEIAARCREAARSLGLEIPDRLSVILAMETAGSTPLKSPVSCWWLNNRSGTRLAIDLLVNQIREVRATGRMPGPEIIRVEPFFIDRGTLGPAGKAIPAGKQPGAKEVWENRWPLNPTELRNRILSINSKPYKAASTAGANDWTPLDLEGIFNRQIGREHGWLGGFPLLHMPRGRQFIHGIPFLIAGGRFSDKPDCIVMRSSHAHAGKGRELPVRVELKIERKAQAVYLLHGSGWTENQKTFASYEFHYTNGTVEVVPIEPFKGGASSQPSEKAQIRGNIQDWWPSPFVPQLQFAHARHCVVTDGGDPFLYERYLYTLEWINPHPDETIKSLVIRSDSKSRLSIPGGGF